MVVRHLATVAQNGYDAMREQLSNGDAGFQGCSPPASECGDGFTHGGSDDRQQFASEAGENNLNSASEVRRHLVVVPSESRSGTAGGFSRPGGLQFGENHEYRSPVG